MRVAILQPTYWGRCHVWNRILSVDVFIWLDHVKFSRSSTKWEDRTVVEASDGRSIVLRLPLRGSTNVPWNRAQLARGWQKHEKSISQCYSRASRWPFMQPIVSSVYQDEAHTIDEVCWRSFTRIASVLSIDCTVVRSSELDVRSHKGQLVLELVKKVGGTRYLSGEPGMTYLPLEEFRAEGVSVDVQQYRAPVTEGGLRNPSVLHLLSHENLDAARDALL